jgi:integrase
MGIARMYTTPIICKSKDGWFVFFRYWNIDTSKYVAKKISRAAGDDLNRIKNLHEREKEFKALRNARETWLKCGWNPLKDPEFKQRLNVSTEDYSDIRQWTVEKALQHALTYKKLAVKSRYDYKKSVEYFLKAAATMMLHVTYISTLNRTHVKACFAYLNTNLKLSAKNYNKRLCHIKSLLSELEEWKAIDENPAFRIKEMFEEKTQKFVSYTDDEREMIREYLYVTNYRFFIFWATIYYTGIRPDEILSLRIKDFNQQTQTLHLKPFSNVVKNKKEREVIVHEGLLQYYKEMKLHEYPEDFYIFSKRFIPGPTKTNGQVPTLLWKKLIWNELGIKKYMYAAKHSGATAFIKAGASEDNLVDHLGHSSKFITRIYTQEGVQQSKLVISKTKVEF